MPEGETHDTAQYKDQFKNLKLIIVPGSGPSLLGRDWLQEIIINWNEVNKVTDITEAYPDVCKEELGLLKDTYVKIHTDKDATPMFHKARPVPLSMKAKVLDELDLLEKQGVIRPISSMSGLHP